MFDYFYGQSGEMFSYFRVPKILFRDIKFKDLSTDAKTLYGSKIRVFEQPIPHSVRAAEISAGGRSIFAHDPKGKVTAAYQSLTREVLADAEKQRKLGAERSR